MLRIMARWYLIGFVVGILIFHFPICKYIVMFLLIAFFLPYFLSTEMERRL
jgi:uncharacterized membrane protein YgaE (UPF0421/DUF939 family)